MNLQNFVMLAKHVFPKRLEGYYLFDKRNDELFELNEEGFNFILALDGSKRLSELKFKNSFLNQLVKHNLLEFSEVEGKREFFIYTPPFPSLRYLEIQLTERCNLECLHCYQGEQGEAELPLDKVIKTLKEFAELQGIRVILSGGEPLLYSRFKELNNFLKNYPARVVLLTNGTIIEKFDVSQFNIDEIQFSLDGIEHGHDYVRGKGSFRRLIKAVEKVKKESAIPISFATMIHRENLDEFKEMKKLVKYYNAKEWGIDLPLLYGNLSRHSELYVNADDALKVMRYRFGASFHSTDDYHDYACGVHLLTLTARGEFLQCSFFSEQILAKVEEGLRAAIGRRRFIKQDEIKECLDCEAFSQCHGGCRFRAGGIGKKDLLMCKVFGKESV
ncbi:MAG: radical SAM protein [bacterium]